MNKSINNKIAVFYIFFLIKKIQHFFSYGTNGLTDGQNNKLTKPLYMCFMRHFCFVLSNEKIGVMHVVTIQ